jgi:tetratricopeptide (TPR) repeat protein
LKLAILRHIIQKQYKGKEGLNKSISKYGEIIKATLSESLEIDPLYAGIYFEKGQKMDCHATLAMTETVDVTAWDKHLKSGANNYLELSLDYIKAGLYEDAIEILSEAIHTKNNIQSSPLIYYYIGYALQKLGKSEEALSSYIKAESIAPDYCFPNKVEEILILEDVIMSLDKYKVEKQGEKKVSMQLYNENKDSIQLYSANKDSYIDNKVRDNENPKVSKATFAKYYLGNLYYDKKQYSKAITLWEEVVAEKSDFAFAYRNLAIAYYNHGEEEPLAYMKKAYELESTNSRFLMEYDQLQSRLGIDINTRLGLLENNVEVVRKRDALYLEYITLLNSNGRFEEALNCLTSYIFHPWEGGEGKVSAQYIYALIEIGKLEKNMSNAIEYFTKTFEYPNNLGEGKLPNVQDTIAEYYIGLTYQTIGNEEKAIEHFKRASVGLIEPSVVLYYNDQSSETIYYQGLALEALGDKKGAEKEYRKLVTFGKEHLGDKVEYDYFAVSLPEIDVFPMDITKRNVIYCKYLMGLGYLGLKKLDMATQCFEECLALQPDYQGAVRHLELIN